MSQFIEILEEENELQHVRKEVDWNLEIGAITRRAIDLRGPAILFENIVDHPGARILRLPFGPSAPLHSRLALSFSKG